MAYNQLKQPLLKECRSANRGGGVSYRSMADKKAQKSLGGRARTSSADAGTSVSKLKRLSLTLGRKKSRDESSSSQQQQRFVDMRSNGVADRNGEHD